MFKHLKIFGFLLLLGVIGCAGQRSQALWVQQHGGIASSAYQERARRVAEPLLTAYSSDQKKLQLHVLETKSLGAFGWRDGQIYLTRGLIDRLDDQELLAAVAHELGHLLDNGSLRGITALQGCRQDLNAEMRADLLGVELLRRQGISASAMPRMLERIMTSDQWPRDCMQLLGQRLETVSRLAAQ